MDWHFPELSGDLHFVDDPSFMENARKTGDLLGFCKQGVPDPVAKCSVKNWEN